MPSRTAHGFGGRVTMGSSIVKARSRRGLEVSTSRRGEGVDPDGYRLLVDGVDRGALGMVGNLVLTDIVAGEHTLMLDGVAPNCRLHQAEGAGSDTAPPANPRSVEVEPGETLAVSYVLSCVPPDRLATLVVRVSEAAGVVPGTYSVFVDGIERGKVTANAELVVAELYPSFM